MPVLNLATWSGRAVIRFLGEKSRALSSCHNGTRRGTGGGMCVCFNCGSWHGHVTALGSRSSLSMHANTHGDAVTKVNTHVS